MGQEVEDRPKPRAEWRHFSVSVCASRLVSYTQLVQAVNSAVAGRDARQALSEVAVLIHCWLRPQLTAIQQPAKQHFSCTARLVSRRRPLSYGLLVMCWACED